MRPGSFVNAAIGGTTTTDWLPSSDPTSAYQRALSLFRAYAANYPAAAKKSFLVSMGTNDALTAGADATWASHMDSTLAAFRTDLGLSSLQAVYTILPAAVPSGRDATQWGAVRAAQISYAASGKIGVQMPDGPYLDGLHFNSVANAAIAALLSAQVA